MLLILASFGTYAVLNSQTTSQPAPTPIVQVSPSLTPDPTADWKTYVSKYGYSFQYPPELDLPTKPSSFAYDVLLENSQYNIGICKPNYCELPEFNDIPLNFVKESVKKTTETIGGKPAYRISGELKMPTGNINTIIDVITLNENQQMQIQTNALNSADLSETTKVLDQILSTFKFTQ